MLRTFIVGLGRAGLELHWPVLRRLREQSPWLFAGDTPLAMDARDKHEIAESAGLQPVSSLEEAVRLTDPAQTVVHVCTPPTARLDLLRRLSAAGFRQIVMEKPLAADAETLAEIDRVRRSAKLRMVVVAHWLDSALTRRLLELIRLGELGPLESISVAQLKPRLQRTLGSTGHPTAFDVELPHSVGVALRIAGDARVAGAELTDMKVGRLVVPGMGSARLELDHDSGPRTTIFSDLASPVRERRIELAFAEGRAIGHFPGGEDDHFAHLTVTRGAGMSAGVSADVFPDDALSTFFTRVYEEFADGISFDEEFRLATRVVELLAEAKAGAVLTGAAESTGPDAEVMKVAS
ncbi:MAG TPA: Gfo/Idh/MocA family oxidoreductase [Streptosporangiaceae bacterium]|nr:Gfo/Idh/MocA family oxidoreductase [Streptosporangiaceae bacterium]